jgi:hypothetical protein
MFLFLAWLLKRVAPAPAGKLLAAQLLLFGIVYPAVAGLDADRQSLYFNLCALTFLALAAWQLVRRFGGDHLSAREHLNQRAAKPAPETTPAGAPLAAPAPSS